jgi:hypothetical protein
MRYIRLYQFYWIYIRVYMGIHHPIEKYGGVVIKKAFHMELKLIGR